MSELNNDKDVLESRKNPLKDDKQQNIEVTAKLRDQQLEKLAKKLEEMGVGEKIDTMWRQAQNDRTEWIERQSKYLQEIDEFIEPIYEQALDWSSTIHLPTILTICKTYHARMYAALLGVDPPFSVRARRADGADRAELIEELMRYTMKDWINENNGVEEQVDKWLWDWVTKGNGILKARWHKRFTRFMDVDTQYVDDVEMQTDPETGDSVPVPTKREIQKEVARTEEVFNGPMLECKPLEDIVVIGGGGDPQYADAVIERSSYSASELWTYVDQKIFRDEQTRKAISAGRDSKFGNDATNAIKQREVHQAGSSNLDKIHEIDRYDVLEAYLKLDVDGSGIHSDIIVWVHKTTREILRATYLRRVNPVGTIPYFKIGFHKRHGQEMDVGLVELLYSLGKEIDAMHNIKVDVGILSSMPIGFYRPTASALKEERLPIEPGALIPVDNPTSDIYFPNMGLRTTFGMQEEQALMNQVERLTSISDLNLGIVGGQGATRTATGTRALLGESSNNLNIYIQRMNRGWKRALRYVFAMLQYRMPPNFQFRVVGDDGDAYWQQVKSTEEIAGMYDFELEANSANSNKQMQVEQANMIYQLTSNPLDMQMGLVTPLQRYEAIANQLKVNGVKDYNRYVLKPQGGMRMLTPLEIADRVLHGMHVDLLPTEDLQGFVGLVQHMMETDEIMGQFGAHEVAALVAKAQEAQAMMAAVQQQQAQQMAAQQQQSNAQAAQQPSNNQPVAVQQQPQQGEGG